MSATRSNLPVADVHVEPGVNHRCEEEVAAGIEPLRDSVARHGVLQLLLVRAREESGVWLVAGHRRLAAALAAELAEGPASRSWLRWSLPLALIPRRSDRPLLEKLCVGCHGPRSGRAPRGDGLS